VIATRAVAGVLLTLVLSACVADQVTAPPLPSALATTSGPATAPTVTPTTAGPTAAPCQPAFVANTQADTESPLGGVLGLKKAAAAGQSGYDRVTFTLGGGSAQPGWRVEYVTAPTSDGSGEPVAVQGPKVLRVIIKDVGYPGDTGVPDPSVKRFSPGDTSFVREVVLDTVFEGQYTSFIGVSSTKAFRVTRLAGPPRVVVDVRHC